MEIATEPITIADVLSLKLKPQVGEENTFNKMRISFKKVVNTAQYETETYEAETVVSIPQGLSGIEVEIVDAVITAQLEYGILAKLYKSGRLAETQFSESRTKLVDYVSSMILSARQLGLTELSFFDKLPRSVQAK